MSPVFQVKAFFDPDATDTIRIEVTASEPIQGNALDLVEVIPQSNSVQNADVTSSFVYEGNNLFVGGFDRNVGFGDIAAIVVTGQDLCANVGISDGSFAKQVKSSKRPVVVRNNVINPLKGGKATIQVEITSPTRVTVSIFDRRGRPIKVLVDEVVATSFDTFWAGINEDGLVVSSGLYIVTIETNSFTETRKIVVRK